MTQPIKDAVTICKTIVRNGYDAYVVNSRLFSKSGEVKLDSGVDIVTDIPLDELVKLFPQTQTTADAKVKAVIVEGGVLHRFYHVETPEGGHPETTIVRLTENLVKEFGDSGDFPLSMACPYMPAPKEVYDGFHDLACGQIRFVGLPDETLKRNYLLAVRAVRFAANFNLPIEENTWMACVRGARRVLDYVSISDVMDEWRKVEAENLWLFVKMLYDLQILHGISPEVAALTRVKQIKNETGKTETIFDHTIEVMRRYPEELPYDWYGVVACLFHDVGKLFTAEFTDGRWTFHQHHHVGARVTRKIMNRLRFEPGDVDLVCHLVTHHNRFNVTLTDRGIRRFKALNEYPRLIEMSRADIKAREGKYTAFNQNLKALERADVPEEMLEPLLNGREIMDFTGLNPGPLVGLLREALLKAQIAGEVNSVPEAVEFVRRWKM